MGTAYCRAGERHPITPGSTRIVDPNGSRGHRGRRLRVDGRPRRPAAGRLPRGRERLHRPPHPPRGAARGPDRRGDPRPHQGDRPQRAGAARRLVVLRAHGRGAPVRDRRADRPRDLPRAAGPRHRRPPAGRTGRPRRERRGAGARVLFARGQRCLPGREPARLRGRRHRGRAVRPAHPGPPDRSRAGRRRHRHRRRRRLVPGRSVRLLHPLRRRLAPVPGVAARGRRSRGAGRPGP